MSIVPESAEERKNYTSMEIAFKVILRRSFVEETQMLGETGFIYLTLFLVLFFPGGFIFYHHLKVLHHHHQHPDHCRSHHNVPSSLLKFSFRLFLIRPRISFLVFKETQSQELAILFMFFWKRQLKKISYSQYSFFSIQEIYNFIY